jgi:hypothetical protein
MLYSGTGLASPNAISDKPDEVTIVVTIPKEIEVPLVPAASVPSLRRDAILTNLFWAASSAFLVAALTVPKDWLLLLVPGILFMGLGLYFLIAQARSETRAAQKAQEATRIRVPVQIRFIDGNP